MGSNPPVVQTWSQNFKMILMFMSFLMLMRIGTFYSGNNPPTYMGSNPPVVHKIDNKTFAYTHVYECPHVNEDRDILGVIHPPIQLYMGYNPPVVHKNVDYTHVYEDCSN